MQMTDTEFGGSGKTDTAKQEASNVAGDAKGAARDVTSTAKEKASDVVGEAKSQTRDLYDQTTSQLRDQAGAQQQRAAQGLRSISDELSSMADRSDGGGVASELVRNASGRAGSVADWLEGRDPGSLLSDVKSFAARKPGTFIAIAAGAGILAGRLTKALAADAKNHASGAATGSTPGGAAAASGPVTGAYAPSTDFSDPAPATSGLADAEPPIRTQAAFADADRESPDTGDERHPLFDDVLGGTAVPGLRTGDEERA
jgi:hypothetical protein